MNKDKMGKLLRKLRTEKKMSLEKLSNTFLEDAYLNVSVNAISNWERGKTIPDIDNLVFLANFYHLSIDEILNGEIKKQNKALGLFGPFDSTNIISKKVLLSIYGGLGAWVGIYSNTKRLLFKLARNQITYSEKEELNTYLGNAFTFRSNLNRPSFLRTAQDIYKKSGDDELFWWDVQKLFRLKDEFKPTFGSVLDDSIEVVKTNISMMENWQKDLFLNAFPYWSNNFKIETAKESLKFLLTSGAKLCDQFISIKVKDEATKTRIIDTIERLYDSLHKPYEFLANYEDGQKHFIKIPNIPYNRMIIEEKMFVSEMKSIGFEPKESFDLLKNNKSLPDSVLQEAYRIYGINTSGSDEEDSKKTIPNAFNCWDSIHKNVFRDEMVQEEIDCLVNRIKNGEKYDYKMKLSRGSDMNSKYKYILSVLEGLSYEEYLKIRDVEKTDKLTKEIDNLSIGELVDKYFTEEKENEQCHKY